MSKAFWRFLFGPEDPMQQTLQGQDGQSLLLFGVLKEASGLSEVMKDRLEVAESASGCLRVPHRALEKVLTFLFLLSQFII